jgi:CDP-4-dehydro-6-deoxyglucose reductase, E3
MPLIHYANQSLATQEGETVLDCLLRNGIAIPHSCKAGACQSCMVKGDGGEIPVQAQTGVKDTLRAKGYFLACSCRPTGDLTVSAVGNEQRIAARIASLDLLNDTVMRVRLRCTGELDYSAGQYVSLFREDGLARSYSLASLPDEHDLELHVRRIPGGAMSQWFHDGARVDGTVWLQGPSGSCFYLAGNSDEPLLLAGTGTGLAPLYGIARDALARGHQGPVWLFHGALEPTGLYLGEEIAALMARHPNLHFVPTVLRGDAHNAVDIGPLDAIILGKFASLKGWKGYICGDPGIVNLLRRKFFLAGMASKAIHADAFLPSAAS